MMSITHAAIATAGTSLILGTAEPLPLGLAILGSQLPDLDTTESTIAPLVKSAFRLALGLRIAFPIARLLILYWLRLLLLRLVFW